jgi:PAS domain S-box-containing protein
MEREMTDPPGRAQEQSIRAESETVRAELAAVLDHAATAVAVYRAEKDGNDFVFVDLNRAGEEIDRVKKEALVGRSLLEVFPGVRDFGLLDVFQRVWRTGEPERHPVSIYRDKRITGWRQNYVCKLPNGHIMAIYDDVSKSKRTELASRMSEQCFRAIANYGYDWEVWIGPTGRVLWTNPAAVDVTGYSIKELMAMRDYPGPLVHEPDRERIARAFRSALRGSKGNTQFRVRRSDSRVIWAEMSWQPIYDENDNPLGHRESIRDITARKQAEEAAGLAEWEKEVILDSLAERIVHLDRDTSILWANRAACASAGKTREQIVGRFCHEVWPGWHESWGCCPAMEAMEKGQRVEIESASSDGRTWFIQAAPVHDHDGAVVGGVEAALDITRYMRPEEA